MAILYHGNIRKRFSHPHCPFKVLFIADMFRVIEIETEV